MTSDQLAIEAPCPRCRGLTKIRYAQICFDGVLKYAADVACESCGTRLVIDGAELPEDVRAQFLVQGGTWRITIADVTGPRLNFIRSLAKALALSPREARGIVNARPPVVAIGTRVEIAYKEEVLGKHGIHTIVELVEDNAAKV